MAPTILHEQAPFREAIKPSDALNAFAYDDMTPAIGREYLDVNIVDHILNAPKNKAEERLRELAYQSNLSKLISYVTIELIRISSFCQRCRVLPQTRQLDK